MLSGLNFSCTFPREFAQRYLRNKAPLRKFNFSYVSCSEPQVEKGSISHLNEDTTAGRARSGEIEVVFTEGLNALAQDLAELLNETLEHTFGQLGLDSPFPWEVHLIEDPDCKESVKFEFEMSEEIYRPILIVNDSQQNLNHLMGESGGWIYIVFHELIEGILLASKYPPTALADFGYGDRRFLFYTRWFRDGLANFGALIADRYITDKTSHDWSPRAYGRFRSHPTPFSTLTQVETDLFDWHQYDDFSPEENRLHYNAALGLFLLIEKHHGRDAIKGIVLKLSELEFPAGDEIESLFAENGIHLRSLIRKFKFPQVGIEFQTTTLEKMKVESVKKDSIGNRWGLRPQDEIKEINGKPFRTRRQLEEELYYNGITKENILRVKRGPKEIQLQLLPSP